MIRTSQLQFGFSLIEMIVSLALFSVVVTISVGALLVLVSSNEQLQDEQSVMTNLSFALDSMTREIRTGTNYFCASLANRNAAVEGEQIFRDGQDLDSGLVRDCSEGNDEGRSITGISFVESGQSVTNNADTRIVYFFDADTNKIYRRISGEDAESIVSSGIHIVNAEFFVTGSEPLGGNNGTAGYIDQPAVTIFIEARESDSSSAKTYNIQTTVTQRTFDI